MFAFVLLDLAAAAAIIAMIVLARGGSLIPERSMKPRRQVDLAKLRNYGIAVALAAVVLLLTRWPGAALAAAAVTVLWPRIIGGAAAGRRQLAQIEAIATWTETLRDTAGAASGLEHAIPATLTAAPRLLEAPLRNLSARLEGRIPLPEALTLFADEVNDRSADKVVAALALNARQRRGGLERILTELALTSRAELEMRRKTEHQRRAVRRQAQQMAAGAGLFAVLQWLFAHSWVEPYSSPVGQIVFIFIACLFFGAFARLRSLSEPDNPPRFLVTADRVTEVAEFKPLTFGGGLTTGFAPASMPARANGSRPAGGVR